MKRCDCAKPMTNAGGLCCCCGGSVYAGGAVGGVVNPVDNVTPQDLTLNIGLAEMPTQHALEMAKELADMAAFRNIKIPKDSVITLPKGVTVRQAVSGEVVDEVGCSNAFHSCDYCDGVIESDKSHVSEIGGKRVHVHLECRKAYREANRMPENESEASAARFLDAHATYKKSREARETTTFDLKAHSQKIQQKWHDEREAAYAKEMEKRQEAADMAAFRDIEIKQGSIVAMPKHWESAQQLVDDKVILASLDAMTHQSRQKLLEEIDRRFGHDGLRTSVNDLRRDIDTLAAVLRRNDLVI